MHWPRKHSITSTSLVIKIFSSNPHTKLLIYLKKNPLFKITAFDWNYNEAILTFKVRYVALGAFCVLILPIYQVIQDSRLLSIEERERERQDQCKRASVWVLNRARVWQQMTWRMAFQQQVQQPIKNVFLSLSMVHTSFAFTSKWVTQCKSWQRHRVSSQWNICEWLLLSRGIHYMSVFFVLFFFGGGINADHFLSLKWNCDMLGSILLLYNLLYLQYIH